MIVCVVPSIRPEQMAEFRKAWAHLFERHNVTLITVWDGDKPKGEFTYRFPGTNVDIYQRVNLNGYEDLICRYTDARRNVGFIAASNPIPDPADGTLIGPADYILTLDDDVHPSAGSDPIQEHLDVLQRRVPISWMNTSLPGVLNRDAGYRFDDLNTPLYLRGFPYGIRDEAPVKVSHGVWVNVPDFDGKTQLELGKCQCVNREWSGPHQPTCSKCNGTGYDGSRLPYSLPYFRGPVPKGTYFPFCGMNVMVHRDALPYLYFAPMGPDSGIEGLNRFADIWCGILLKRATDSLGWAIYTGASTVIHTRASDPHKNVEQERLGVEWNEKVWKQHDLYQTAKHHSGSYPGEPDHSAYWRSYLDKAARFRDLIRKLQGAT